MSIPDLIQRIERHCAERNIKETTFGLNAVNDGKLVSRLREGKTVTLATLDRIEAALAKGGQTEDAA